MEQFMSLAEAARDLGTDIELLIRSAICDDLTVFANANGWAVQGDDEMPPNNLKGQVYLLAEDLQQGLGAESIPVCQVRMPENDEIVKLLETQQVRRGVIYITVEEFDRFRRQHALTLKVGTGSPPYLNKHHDWYSTQLAIAVQAWLDLFSDGHFDAAGTSTKHKIREWLSKNAGQLKSGTRENIAKLINPDDEKWGGAPRTPVKKT